MKLFILSRGENACVHTGVLERTTGISTNNIVQNYKGRILVYLSIHVNEASNI